MVGSDWVVVVMAAVSAATATPCPGELVGSAGQLVGCVDAGALVWLAGPSGVAFNVTIASSPLPSGCSCAATGSPGPGALVPSAVVQFKRRCQCPASRYHKTNETLDVVDQWWFQPAAEVTAPPPTTSNPLLRPPALLSSLGWNTTVMSLGPRYFTTELTDAVTPGTPPNATSVWAGQTDTAPLTGSSRSSLEPVPVAEFRARVHYGSSPWSANGKGTLALPPALDTASAAVAGWYRAAGSIACGFPVCHASGAKGAPGPSKYPMKTLANGSTADQCEALCIKTEG